MLFNERFLKVFSDTCKEEYPKHKVKSIAENLYTYYQEPSAYHVFPDFFPFANGIQSQKLIAVSNFDNRLINILKKLKISQYMSDIITSENANSSKPNAKIFMRAVEHLKNIQPKHILHIGDDISKDYNGARAMGWHALLMCRDGHSISETIPKDHICKDFHDVTNWLQKTRFE